jgi:hypothetical protein
MLYLQSNNMKILEFEGVLLLRTCKVAHTTYCTYQYMDKKE